MFQRINQEFFDSRWIIVLLPDQKLQPEPSHQHFAREINVFHRFLSFVFYLVGGAITILKNMSSSMGRNIYIFWKNMENKKCLKPPTSYGFSYHQLLGIGLESHAGKYPPRAFFEPGQTQPT
jgi:hypothetical protein